jgi:Aerotolerance regulator N-terminal
MMLLNPIWLFALAALSIPVAIHLWNTRRGKTLKVGSIMLINASAQKSSMSIKLNDLLLLLLRCLLLASLAFVLAMPFWQRGISSATIKGWLLIPKENARESYQKFKPEIDSLSKAGFEFHYFNKGFDKAELNAVLASNKDSKPTEQKTKTSSYWSLIQQLDAQVPPSLPVYLFTPNGVTHFTGSKPQVSLDLHWRAFTAADSSSTWIEQAWLTNKNNIEIVEGNSRSTGTYFTNYIIQSPEKNNSPFQVSTDSGRLTVALKNAEKPVAVDTSTFHFAIYSEKNTTDADYLKAALASVVQFTGHKAIIKQYGDASQISAHQNWIFWLSQKPKGKLLAQNSNNLFIYETGKIKEVNSWINQGDESLSPQKNSLYRLIIPNDNRRQTLWNDGFGDPVLSLEKQQQTNIYHFYSRFDPLWNDLVWTDDFPKILLRLITNTSSNPDEKYERRIMNAKQVLPTMSKQVHPLNNKITKSDDLTHYCWLVLALLFLMERWLVNKKAAIILRKSIIQND